MTDRYDLFPQPTAGDLAAEPNHWLALNPYWWFVVQGLIDNIARPDYWQDYTPEIDRILHKIMVGDELPVTTSLKAKVHLGSDVTIDSHVLTTINMANPVYTLGVADNGTGFTILESGYYAVVACIGFVIGGGFREVAIKVDSTIRATKKIGSPEAPIGDEPNYIQCAFEGHLNANQLVSVMALHNAGAPIDVFGGENDTWMAIHSIG